MAAIGITTGVGKIWRCSLRRALCRCVGMAPRRAGRAACLMRLNHVCSPRGGITATEYETGEQWIKPNGWAPLQWMAIQGFKQYSNDSLGDGSHGAGYATVNHFYKTHHKLIQVSTSPARVPHAKGGGGIPCRMAFGWTNGVVRRLVAGCMGSLEWGAVCFTRPSPKG